MKDKMIEMFPVRRFGKPEEVAKVAMFCCQMVLHMLFLLIKKHKCLQTASLCFLILKPVNHLRYEK